MRAGRVIGEVWASRRVAGLAGHSLKLVAMVPEGAGERAADPALAWASLDVAIDTLDARAGQAVLLAYGSGARNVLAAGPDNRQLLCDAAIALIVDGHSGSTPSAAGAGSDAPSRGPSATSGSRQPDGQKQGKAG